jgi:hypothetical protein
MESRRTATRLLIGTCVVLALVSYALFALTSLYSGVDAAALVSPLAWIEGLDRQALSGILFSASQVVGGLLAIAITVSAIVVELAATRYNHRITLLFVREPTNVAVMSLFVVTTLLCIWTALGYESDALGALSGLAFATVMALVSACILLLLPYFAFVFVFLSPLSIIDKIRSSAYVAIARAARGDEATSKRAVLEAIDELQDVARSATEQSDRSIAMACVDALRELVTDYQTLRSAMSQSWFRTAGPVADDPDFVSFAPGLVDDIERERLWVEVKVFRQYLSLMAHCVPASREVANLIAIDTQRIGVEQGRANRPLLELVIRCMNSFLRTSINAADPRTSYYVMNQYRMLAEALMQDGLDEPVREIAGHLKAYGQLAHTRGQSFILQIAAFDLTSLVEASLERRPSLTDDLLSVVLEVDQEIRSETQEESLLGVRKAQLQLATLFAVRGDEVRARRICVDLAGERMVRLERLRRELEGETRERFWELEDRGVNFGYLPPERRAALARLLGWMADMNPTQSR